MPSMAGVRGATPVASTTSEKPFFSKKPASARVFRWSTTPRFSIDQYNVDLIAMATHQRQGLSHVIFGSITEDTVNHSDIPVLAVPVNWMKD